MKYHKIDYIEFASNDLDESKQFFSDVFAWSFQDYGEAYSAILEAGIDGGIFQTESKEEINSKSILIVFYSDDLLHTKTLVENAQAEITQDIFQFPGGHRFHFKEPGGIEMAVWSDK